MARLRLLQRRVEPYRCFEFARQFTLEHPGERQDGSKVPAPLGFALRGAVCIHE